MAVEWDEIKKAASGMFNVWTSGGDLAFAKECWGHRAVAPQVKAREYRWVAIYEVCCKRCGAADHVKNGIVRGFQRYHCLSCGCNFTMTPPRGKPPAMKALALLLYAMGNVSFCSIARILGVSDVAVLNWVRDEARKLPEPSLKAELVVVTLDEMWHFVKKRLTNSGFGGPMTLLLGEPLPGFLVAVMTPHAKNSSTKSASKARPSSPMTGKAITVSSPRANSSPEKT